MFEVFKDPHSWQSKTFKVKVFESSDPDEEGWYDYELIGDECTCSQYKDKTLRCDVCWLKDSVDCGGVDLFLSPKGPLPTQDQYIIVTGHLWGRKNVSMEGTDYDEEWITDAPTQVVRYHGWLGMLWARFKRWWEEHDAADTKKSKATK